ncbi:uncharacterized protein G2W53_010871 [Senna tora]|uniref:Uncharacterized protein n=1 Tax=Senna tora TaxID=362788 RepID=A0A835CEJ2_9FABA|nr:uncharacterized protein G2W53_010871 [Senna tora]
MGGDLTAQSVAKSTFMLPCHEIGSYVI